jgi:hypothetical protein
MKNGNLFISKLSFFTIVTKPTKESSMGEHWSHNQKEEELNRRQLFQKARKGDAKAPGEVKLTYGVRLWSEKERAKLVHRIRRKGRK